MRRLLRRRPSPAMVVALIALFVSLGGSAFALVVTGGQIRNGSVTGADIKRNTLTGRHIREARLSRVRRAARADRVSDRALAEVSTGGFAALREHSPGFRSGGSTILTLDLPAGGNLLVFAKTNIVNLGGLPVDVTCSLRVGGDVDDAHVTVGGQRRASMAMAVPHLGAAAVQARLVCADPAGGAGGSPLRRASSARIMAVRLDRFGTR